MKEFKGTQGPWEVIERLKVIGPVVKKEGYVPYSEVICNLEHGSYVGQSWEEKEANAKLIAAAPELLESLENCLEAINDLKKSDHGWDEVIDIAKSAIKKALGE